MAPFPEAEDMTVKRLYVALKRDDMQLLQMGAHKLHEKYHTGYKFQLLDDLRQILSYVEEQQIPNDIKELLTKTITDILENKEPDSSYYNDEPKQNEIQTFEPLNKEPVSNLQTEDIKQETEQFNNSFSNEQKPSASFSYFEAKTSFEHENNSQQSQNVEAEEKQTDDNFEQDSAPILSEQKEEPVIFTPKDAVVNMVNTIDEVPISNTSPEIKKEETPSFKIIQEKELTLNNVAVFYDDKAPFIDYLKNKSYRLELDALSLNKDANPILDAPVIKSAVDIQTDEFSEILKMLNTIKGDVYFVTTSKSENLLKTFIENNINFKIQNVQTKNSEGKQIEIVPLFGLSNIFYCPKCGKREAVVTLENKILTVQCSECSSVMYPDTYEALNFESNASPFNFLQGINAMAGAETWILINPPLESSRALTSMFLKTAFQASKPKKVYILSKETTKKEYYKQMFVEIDSSIEVKADFITEDSLCEEFINSEMSTIKVTA